jgi:hypothetical protein
VRVEPRRRAGPAAQNKVGGTLSDTEPPATTHPHLTTLDPGILCRARAGPVRPVHEPIVKPTRAVRNGRMRAASPGSDPPSASRDSGARQVRFSAGALCRSDGRLPKVLGGRAQSTYSAGSPGEKDLGGLLVSHSPTTSKAPHTAKKGIPPHGLPKHSALVNAVGHGDLPRKALRSTSLRTRRRRRASATTPARQLPGWHPARPSRYQRRL